MLAKLKVTTHLYVATVVAAGGKLDPAEGDGALEGHLDGCLLHPVFPVGPGRAGDGAAAEVPLYWWQKGKAVREGHPPGHGRPEPHPAEMASSGTGRAKGRRRPLTLGDAVLRWQQALLQEALQHRADRRPVNQLQHEQVGLRGRRG